jgi:quercetin dioxygenase-like cupin family protein
MKLKKTVSSAKQWLFNDGSMPVNMRVITAPEIQKIEHFHKSLHEYFYVIKGWMKISIDGKIIAMTQDDLVIVEPGEHHVVVENSDNLLLILLMPPPAADDKVLVRS